jgi:hypothetical protein
VLTTDRCAEGDGVGGAVHAEQLRHVRRGDERRVGHVLELDLHADLGFGRVVAVEIEAPTVFVNPAWSG